MYEEDVYSVSKMQQSEWDISAYISDLFSFDSTV